MNELLEKIEKGKTAIAEFERELKQTRREAEADGTVDAREKAEIDAIEGNIRHLRDRAAALQAEFDSN
jgi:chromosome segregation ATPase